MGKSKTYKGRRSYKERTRLLTEAEKKVITESYYGRDKKKTVRAVLIIVLVLAIISVAWGGLCFLFGVSSLRP